MNTSLLAGKTQVIGKKDVDKGMETIFDRIKGRDMNAILDWVEERQNRLYKIGWSYLSNQQDVEDVMQNTILKIYDNIGQLRDERYFETWVTSILMNECKSILRRKKKNIALEEIEYLGAMEDEYSGVEFREFLGEIDESHREVLVLKYLSGYTQEEIAGILKMPVGTIKSRIYRGLKALREVIKGEVL